MTTQVIVMRPEQDAHSDWVHQVIARDTNTGIESVLAVLKPGQSHVEYVWDSKEIIVREIRS